MSRSISSNARQQVQSPEMNDVLLVALDIGHPSIPTIRVVNNNENIEWGGNTYEASSFKFQPPQQQEGELQNASLTLSNIDRRMVEAVRSISSSPTITANILFVGATVEREAGPWVFDLSEVRYNAETITGTLTWNLKPKQTLSTVRVTLNNFPGLMRAQ